MKCLSLEQNSDVLFIVSIISFTLDLAVILLSLIPKIFEPLTRNILINISINSMLSNLLFIIGLYSEGDFCLFISYFKSCLLLPGILWSSLIPKILHSVIINQNNISSKQYKYCFIFTYLIVPLIFLLPFSTNSYNSGYHNCSGLNKSTSGIIWRFVLIYAPSILIILIVLVYCVQIYKKLKKTSVFGIWSFLIDRGMIYSLIFLVVFIQLIIARIIELINDDCYAKTFLFIGIFCIFMTGTFNFIATLLRKDVCYGLLYSLKVLNRAESNAEYIEEIINKV